MNLKSILSFIKCNNIFEIIYKIWILKILRKEIVVSKFDKNLKIILNLKNNVDKSIFMRGYFEKDIVDFFKKYLKRGMTVFDIGANIGQYTLLSAKIVGKKGKVYSFEPSIKVYNNLKSNVDINNFENVIINNIALGDCEETTYLNESNDGAYSSIGEPLVETTHKTKINVTTLNKYIQTNKIKKIDLIKIDVEGFELMVLKGGKNFFSKKDAPVVVCEFSDLTSKSFNYSSNDLRKYFIKLGYHLYFLKNQKLIKVEKDLNHVNYDNLLAIKDILIDEVKHELSKV